MVTPPEFQNSGLESSPMSGCIQREQAVIKHCLLAIDTACTKASPGRCFFFKGSSVVFGAGCDTQQPHTAPLVSQCLPTRRPRAPGAHSPSGRSRGEGEGRCACALVSLPFFTRPSPGRAAAPSPGDGDQPGSEPFVAFAAAPGHQLCFLSLDV